MGVLWGVCSPLLRKNFVPSILFVNASKNKPVSTSMSIPMPTNNNRVWYPNQ